MKKILLGTTALIGAATLYASVAAAGEDPKVTVGGFNTFEAAWTKDDFDHNERNRAFRNDTEIHFNIAGKTDANLGYGAEIDLQADIDGAGNSVPGASNPGQTNSGIVARRTYGWLQGDQWGHFEFGSNEGAASTLKVDASNIARASGGINGDWKYFADVNNSKTASANGPAGVFGNPTGTLNSYITAAALPVEHGPTNGFASDLWGNDDKITYYTPRFQGFQVGVSYAPSLSNRGELTNRYQTVTNEYQDIWEGGVNYEGHYDNVGLAVGATGELGKSPSGQSLENMKAWNAGAKASFMGFSLAGSYGDWRDSLATVGTDTKSDYWTVGGAYETGPFGASVTYLASKVNPSGLKDKFQDVAVGVDYKLAPGLTPFVEYTWYDMDPTGSALDSGYENKGNIVLVGSQLSF